MHIEGVHLFFLLGKEAAIQVMFPRGRFTHCKPPVISIHTCGTHGKILLAMFVVYRRSIMQLTSVS